MVGLPKNVLDIRQIKKILLIFITLIVVLFFTSCKSNQPNFFSLFGRFLGKPIEVIIYADQKWQRLNTTSRLPKDWLLQARLNLAVEDKIWINGVEWEVNRNVATESPILLQINRAHLIQLDDNGKVSLFRSAEPSVIAALVKQGVPVNEGDEITPNGDTLIDKPLEVKIRRSTMLKISNGIATLQTRSTAVTVREALVKAEVPLQGWEEVSPSLDSLLPNDGLILIIPIREQLLLDYELTPYTTERRTLAEVEVGQQQMIQEGAQGVKVDSRRVRLRGEEQIFQVQLPRWNVRDAQTRIVGVGSKLVPKTMEIPGGKITYWQAIPMYATSYSPCRVGKPGVCDYTTATGARLQKGVVAVTREDFALFGNSQVYIPGYGFATVADIGGGIPGKRWIDLGYGEEDYQPWSKEVMVYILAPSE